MSKLVRAEVSRAEIDQALEAIRSQIRNRRTWPPTSENEKRASLREVDELDPKAKRIVEYIEQCFPLRPLPKFDPHYGDLDYRDFRSFAEKVPWNEVDGLRLVSCADYIYVMDSSMFAYYLPAYLTTFLTLWPRSLGMNYFDRVLDYLNLTYESTVFHRMTREQRKCALAFLRFFAKLTALWWGDTEQLGQDLAALAELWRESLELPTRS